MRVETAQHAGFCFGVERAVSLVEALLKEGTSPLYTYGPIIHNEEVIQNLKSRGVTVIEDLEKLDTDLGSVRAKAYDIVLNGIELGGGSERIYRPDIQERMFKALGIDEETANEKFGFLLDAFKYGVPPHAGLAIGLDRLIMLMTGADSIRDVIAFPKVKDASCLLTGAPDVVDEKQLKELGVEVKQSE